jgi:ankyrin repeat protein
VLCPNNNAAPRSSRHRKRKADAIEAVDAVPLHHCVRLDANADPSAPQLLERVRCLVERHPGALTKPAKNGNLPLHVAVRRGKVSLDVVRMLVEPRPGSVQHKNRKGLLPLQVAALNREAPLDVLFYLVSRDPESLVGQYGSSRERRPRPRKRPKLHV